jgi:hypothetical protein
METLSIHTLVGDILELPCVSNTRGAVIHALHQYDEFTYPLEQTDAVPLEGTNDWMTVVFPDPPIPSYMGLRVVGPTKTGKSFHEYKFNLLTDCFEPHTLEEPPTERQRSMARYGTPFSITITEIPEDEDDCVRYSINHLYRRQTMTSYSETICTGCCDSNHQYTVLTDLLNHCAHAVQEDGTCRRLKPQVASDILRLYDVYYTPLQ